MTSNLTTNQNEISLQYLSEIINNPSNYVIPNSSLIKALKISYLVCFSVGIVGIFVVIIINSAIFIFTNSPTLNKISKVCSLSFLWLFVGCTLIGLILFLVYIEKSKNSTEKMINNLNQLIKDIITQVNIYSNTNLVIK